MIRGANSAAMAAARRKERRAAGPDMSGVLPRVRTAGGPLNAENALGFRQWAEQVPALKAGKLNFDLFPYQKEIYDSFGAGHKDVVVRKGTQVGASELMVRWALWQADVHGRTIMYVFPTSADVYDWGDIRIQPLFERAPLMDRIGEPFNKGLKHVGPGFVAFRGSESKRKLDSVDCDGLCFDEYDTLNQRNIPDAERRISGQLSAGLIRRVGVPSLPEYGISEQYEMSDRRKWLVRCTEEACRDWTGTDREQGDMELRCPDRKGGWQEIDFWRNVKWDERLGGRLVENARRVCAHCGEPLDVAKGVWVAQQPESPMPGYHISALIAPGADLTRIVRNSKKTTPYEIETLYNKDLGMPYVSKTARLSVEEIKAAQREFALVSGFAGQGLVTMGVDVASERALNVRISLHFADNETKRALWIGEVQDDDRGLAFDQVADLMDRYNVAMCAIDHLPETRMARQLQARFPGRVYLVKVTGQNQKLVINVDPEMGDVSVRRTELLDSMVEMIRSQRNLLPAVLPDNYSAHLTANARHVQADPEKAKVEVKWIPTRPDDYAFAEAYDVVATELFYWRLQVDSQIASQVEQPLEAWGHEFRRSHVNEYGEAGRDDYVQPGSDDNAHGFYWPENA